MEIAELDALLQSARQPETTVPLCLRGDLQADWEELDKQLAEVRSQGTSKLAETASAEAVALAERIRALEAQMAEATIQMRFRALPRRPWMALIEAHPGREGHEFDKMTGLNQDTFYDALIAASVVAPEFTPEQLTALLDMVTAAQFDTLSTAVWNLNRRDVSVPFSFTASQITTSSAGT